MFPRYDPSTGVLTVPPGGDGLYYFSTYVLVDYGEAAAFNIRVNGANLCTAYGDNDNNGASDHPQGACGGLAQLIEGMRHSSFFCLVLRSDFYLQNIFILIVS